MQNPLEGARRLWGGIVKTHVNVTRKRRFRSLWRVLHLHSRHSDVVEFYIETRTIFGRWDLLGTD